MNFALVLFFYFPNFVQIFNIEVTVLPNILLTLHSPIVLQLLNFLIIVIFCSYSLFFKLVLEIFSLLS
jgi:hypothetical protein